MVQQRKCCRCPCPLEVDSDGRGEKLLLLRSWKVGGVGVDNKQLQSIAFSTTGYVRSTLPYHPHGAPIFPKLPKITKQNKTNKQQIKITI